MNELTELPQPSTNGVSAANTTESSVPVEPSAPDNAGLIDVPTPDATVTDAIDLDTLLAETLDNLTRVESTEAEVTALLAVRESLRARTDAIPALAKHRVDRIEAFHPLRDVTPQHYQRLAELGLTTHVDAARMEQVATALARIEALPISARDFQLDQRRGKLADVRANFEIEMTAQLAGEQVDIAMRRERARATASTLYTTRLNELEEQISAIETNPAVQERLAELDAAAFAAQIATQEAERQRIEAENQATIREFSRELQSVTARQRTALDRLSRVVGNEMLGDSLVRSMTVNDRDRALYYATLRTMIIDQILVDDGQMLGRPSDFIPFAKTGKGIDYNLAIKHLEQAPAIVQQQAHCERAFALDRAFRAVIGKQWYYNPETKQQVLGPIYQALETRRLNDRIGETARLQQALRNRKAAEQQN